ncbi:MAG: U32 family peptidase [Eubacteriales bacterium]|nr:U32 family peptidase [Eubacteriales bacterium]
MDTLKIKRKTELLAPAGSFDSARAAVNAGADAIYMGGPLFSARAFAESSAEGGCRADGSNTGSGSDDRGGDTPDMLSQALDFCHLRGVKVFMTLNTLLKESELETVTEYLRPYAEKHLDGVIVQDLGVFKKVREEYPELELHISTQAAVTGWRTAKRYTELGAKRIVLARELSLSEIREIYEKTGAELEVFAHGALCYSYSGECLMSSFIGGRSGNRGKCAGTCRLPFDVYAANAKPGEAFSKAGKSTGRRDRTEDDAGSMRLNKTGEQYLLSMCDLNTLGRLTEMIKAGVYSFKIEGRMKSPLYTAAVTSVYRKYLDLAEQLVSQSTAERAEAPTVMGSHDTYVRTQAGGYRVEKRDARLLSEVFDRSGTTSGYLDGLNGREMLTLLAKPEHRNRDEAVIEELKKKYIDNDKKVQAEAVAVLRLGKKPGLTLKTADGAEGLPGGTGSADEDACPGHYSVTVTGELPLEAAASRPATETEVREKLSKFGGTDFELTGLTVEMDDNLFVPVKVLNDLRRRAADELKRCILSCGS